MLFQWWQHQCPSLSEIDNNNLQLTMFTNDINFQFCKLLVIKKLIKSASNQYFFHNQQIHYDTVCKQSQY